MGKKSLLTILGCGTSVGAPMIGMKHLAQFKNSKNHRMRASCLLEVGGRGGPAILIDASPDLRTQALRFLPPKKPRIDALLLTHAHADHLHGLDDVRPFNFLNKVVIPVYSDKDSIAAVQSRFPYIFEDTYQEGGGKPKLQLVTVATEFTLKEVEDPLLKKLRVRVLPVKHGSQNCIGFRIGAFAYITDTTWIPPTTLALLQNLEVLILDCLRPKPHSTHLNVEQAIDYAHKIGAKKTIFTHMSWELEYESFKRSLPRKMVPAYDGMKISLSL